MLPLTERAQHASRPSGSMKTIPPGTLPPPAPPEDAPQPPSAVGPAPTTLVAIGASTGGPPALQQLMTSLDPGAGYAVLITQHMPPRFTRAFAERLARTSRFVVREAEEGDHVTAGVALVAPGSGSIALRRDGNALRVTIEPEREGAICPSVDRMLETAAAAMGDGLLGVVLTGMGGDGGKGVRVVKAHGGRVIAEAAETAVIFGMPQEAIASGAVDEVLPLGRIADAIDRFARRASPEGL
jgi:two-component system chemotaxis response regulator CheB